ncbi:MAG: hypothetical protein KF744_09225 [Taibaiella sp.]|nr:hypothetical protein [Taibaiella sp.]
MTATIYHAKSVNKERYFYIAQMGEFYAHGEELKGAMEDVRYKMMADRMKKEPIHADTIVSIEHYRAITGACKAGCAMWLESNGLAEVKEMRADMLLPLLQKSNAYGYERFRSLVTF